MAKLNLDPLNPRITQAVGSTPEKLLAWMVRDEAIDELALSFAEHGYFSEEPLVVVKDEAKPGNFVVVEGNRRLAALKLLLEPGLRAKLQVTGWPTLSDEVKKSLEEVPTVEYGSRDEVVPYLGFRHITGVKTWDPFAKARYVAQLIDTGRNIADIEQGIGDSASTVKKLYQSLLVYNQAIAEGVSAKDLAGSFSLLEVALAQQPIKKYLGLPRELPQRKTERLIDDEHIPQLKKLISWVFGDSSRGEIRVIRDSRQITQKLAPVLADKESLDYLELHRDLDGAYERSGGEREFMLKQVVAATRAAQRALGEAPAYKGDKQVQGEVDKLKKVVDALEREVR